jgi:pyruvate,orthophosphate dikinase
MPNELLSQTFACGAQPTLVSGEVLGHKAANLVRMAQAGLPVPPGFVLTTAVCRDYFSRQGRMSDDFPALLARNIQHIERATGLIFGGARRPLLVSVRSGAPVSMPGMMDTILNVGLCDRTVSPLIRLTGNPRFVWDSYRRLVQTYAEVVHGVPPNAFDRLLGQHLRREAMATSADLDAMSLRELTQQFLQLFADHVGHPFPQEPPRQLASATEAVFRSWRSPRAVAYRRLRHIQDDLGTAVTVQAMVFGNMGSLSGSGVAFTRDPTTGENQLYMDFLWNAQGEDVVSGRHALHDRSPIQQRMPSLDSRLQLIGKDLERLFSDVQDFEFTIQEGQLCLLQSRPAHLTPWAALRIACDLVSEGVIDEQQALRRLANFDLEAIQVIRLVAVPGQPALAMGVAACPGVAVGPVALEPRRAIAMAHRGHRPILVRQDISTEDVAGLAASEGILTALGGRTSHAAVVARQMNKVCIVGCRDLVIDANRRCRLGGEWFTEGDLLSLDGNSGSVYSGKLEVVSERPVELLAVVQQWKQRHGVHLTESAQ